jgi:hypothetical protein
MFLAMRRFFFCVIFLLLAGCEREPAVITPPKEAAAVIEPFLKELRAGQPARAAALVSPAAQDELAGRFAKDHKSLASASPLTPRFVTKGFDGALPGQRGYSAEGDEVTLVYASKKDGRWTSATVRAYRYRDEPYKVEYWRITNTAPTPALQSGIKPEDVRKQHQFIYALFGGMALFGVIGLALLIWLVKRRPQLISPEAVEETRASAVSVRDEE